MLLDRTMARARVTIVVSAREQFCMARRSLESLLAHVPPATAIVYVDAGSPPWVAAHLRAQSRQHRFRLIRFPRYLSPTESRILAMPHVDSEYVVFIDNDVLTTPGWLEALVGCADETGAWAVGPLYCNDEPSLGQIHMAGGDAQFYENDGQRGFRERHHFAYQYRADVGELKREPTELVEYHCLLMRTEALDECAPLDARYLSSGESIDPCLRLREAGHSIYLEPEAVVANVPPPPFAWSDVPYYLLRWSDVWNRLSLEHFRQNWDLPKDDPWLAHHYGWLTEHRELALDWTIGEMRKVLGWRRGEQTARRLVHALERQVTRRYLRYRPDLQSIADHTPAPMSPTPTAWWRP
jgi:GT2 family glycosyltransferase